jgi:hypothetical protein
VFRRGRRDDEHVTGDDFALLGQMLMRLDAKLDAILDELGIDYGEETDHT